MSQESLNLSPKSRQIQDMFNKISAKYNFLNSILSFGQDKRWRRALIQSLPKIQNKEGVLYDVACGTGDVVLAARKNRSDYHSFSGFDISSGMLEQAKSRTPHLEVKYILASAEHLPVKSETADAVTIAFGLRNVDNREQALSEFNRVLKKGGSLFILEFFPAKNTLFRSVFNFYFKKILPIIGGILSDKSAYSYLPHSVKTMPLSDEFEILLKENGFEKIKHRGWLSGSTMLFQCIKSK